MNETHFLNIDLELEADFDLKPIVDEFAPDVTVLGSHEASGRFHAAFETGYGDPNEIVLEYERLVDRLSPEARKLWDKCSSIVFDVGIEGGASPRMYQMDLTEKSINVIARLGGKIVVSVYANKVP